MPERSDSRAGADSVLVTGGAGYIGSHTVRQLVRAGHEVVVIDNLYSGHRRSLADEVPLYIGDAGDRELAQRVMTRHGVSTVIHFAGHIVVPESVANPLKYYRNNVAASLALIESCRQTGVRRFVFSSSAAVYGIPAVLPVGEDAVTVPINPYGTSKLVTEWTLRDVAAAAGADPFAFVALRYFNVAGASLDGSLGQATPDATHLVKVACEAACGRRERVEIFGTDYDTPDGTCIRDYIHVEDLAGAHLDALRHLDRGGSSAVLNAGYGHGFSVREVLDTVRRVSGTDFEVVETGRRPGDPPRLVADNRRIRELLGWTPRHDDLELICATALAWERSGGFKIDSDCGSN